MVHGLYINGLFSWEYGLGCDSIPCELVRERA
jgi:hypothetical protein